MTDAADAADPDAGPEPGAPDRLGFDVVIATRNRPEALALSIPLILAQSRQPERLIVIDSSDDHAPVAAAVAQAAEGWPGTVIVEHSVRGSAHQRNRGLVHVGAPVVIFPDDDSLMHPGTTEAMLRFYERDREGRIAGVCAADAVEPPPGVLPDGAYAMTGGQRREARTLNLRNRLERRIDLFNPFMYMGRLLAARHAAPDWMAEEDCVFVEWMGGYRMSFRTAAIRAEGFEEMFEGYGLFEDIDAGFAMARHGALVGARRARIHHHKFPGSRAGGFTLGARQVLNRAYVVLRHVHDAGFTPEQRATAIAKLKGRIAMKLLTCLARPHSAYARAQLRGAWAAARAVRAMIAAPRADLPDLYRAAAARLRG